jgi:hypothetical protein
VLEEFHGAKGAIDAPDWTAWESPRLEFQQPRASFAVLFLQMATWEVNQSRVRNLCTWCALQTNVAISDWAICADGPMGYISDVTRNCAYISLSQ